MKKKSGVIKPNGISVETHEFLTLVVLTNNGFDVEICRPSYTPNSKSPDILMRGLLWEIKSPTGKSSRTIEHIIKKAVHQSCNVILDLARLKYDEQSAIEEARKCFTKFRSLRNLWIITKDEQIVKYKKR